MATRQNIQEAHRTWKARHAAHLEGFHTWGTVSAGRDKLKDLREEFATAETACMEAIAGGAGRDQIMVLHAKANAAQLAMLDREAANAAFCGDPGIQEVISNHDATEQAFKKLSALVKDATCQDALMAVGCLGCGQGRFLLRLKLADMQYDPVCVYNVTEYSKGVGGDNRVRFVMLHETTEGRRRELFECKGDTVTMIKQVLARERDAGGERRRAPRRPHEEPNIFDSFDSS